MNIKRHILLVGFLPGTIDAVKKDYQVTLLLEKSEVNFHKKRIIEEINKVDKTIIIEYNSNKETVTNKLKVLHEVDPFHGVMSYSEFGVEMASYLASLLRIPGLNHKSVMSSRDKLKFREILKKKCNEINVDYKVVRNKNEIIDFYNKHEKIVIKPITGMGSHGVKLIESYNDIDEGLEHAKNNTDGMIMVEEYCFGREFSVETFSNRGKHHIIGITDKTNTGAPYFVGKIHTIPAVTSNADERRIIRAVSNCLDALEVQYGIGHTEIKVEHNKVSIIESHIRPGGNFRELIMAAFDIDIYKIGIDGLFNKELDVKPIKSNSATITYILLENGIVNGVEGVEDAFNDPNLKFMEIKVDVGDSLEKLDSTSGRAGTIICQGNTPQDSIKNAIAIRNSIEISLIKNNT